MSRFIPFVLVAVAAGCSSQPDKKSAAPDSLYTRLGGLAGIARFSDDAVNRVLTDPDILANPNLAMRAKPEGVPGLKVQITILLCDLTGGPETYLGKGMLEAHKGMGVDEKQWAAFMRDMKASMVAVGFAQKEQDEFLAVFEGLKKDIVEAK